MAKRMSKKSAKVAPLSRLVDGLRSTVPAERDRAAIELRDFMKEAKAALWRSIRKQPNRNHRGTLVWTLQWFDCSRDFDNLIELALNGNYEVQCHSLCILQEQSFRVKQNQLRAARRLIRALRPREKLSEADLRLLRAEFESAMKRFELIASPLSVHRRTASSADRIVRRFPIRSTVPTFHGFTASKTRIPGAQARIPCTKSSTRVLSPRFA